MARTHRDTLNAQRRDRRRSWQPAIFTAPIAAEFFDYSDPVNRYPRLRGGNMLMAPSVCGIWSDERPAGGPDRKAQRRTVKRSERQAWRKDALDNLLTD